MHGSGCGGYTGRVRRGDQIAIESDEMIVRNATIPTGCEMSQ